VSDPWILIKCFALCAFVLSIAVIQISNGPGMLRGVHKDLAITSLVVLLMLLII
jgi:hypothetical protein